MINSKSKVKIEKLDNSFITLVIPKDRKGTLPHVLLEYSSKKMQFTKADRIQIIDYCSPISYHVLKDTSLMDNIHQQVRQYIDGIEQKNKDLVDIALKEAIHCKLGDFKIEDLVDRGIFEVKDNKNYFYLDGELLLIVEYIGLPAKLKITKLYEGKI